MLSHDPVTGLIRFYDDCFMTEGGQVRLQHGDGFEPYPAQNVDQWLRKVLRLAEGFDLWQIHMDARGLLDLFAQGRLVYQGDSLYSQGHPVTLHHVGFHDMDPHPDQPLLSDVFLDDLKLPPLRVQLGFNRHVGWADKKDQLHEVPMVPSEV